MYRPDWEQFATIGGSVYCTCGAMLHSQHALREHWQDGHFDLVRKKPKEPGPAPDRDRIEFVRRAAIALYADEGSERREIPGLEDESVKEAIRLWDALQKAGC